MANTTSKLWILKSKGSESSFGGNKGYADDPISTYLYDTTVKNHDKIEAGDNIIITGKKFIIGYAIISYIETKENVPKIRYRCPVCNTQEHYERKSITPRYKCRKKHEFDVPNEEPISVTEFSAEYGANFVPAEPKTSVKILDPYYLKRNRYYSIQPAHHDFFKQETPHVFSGFQPTVAQEPGLPFVEKIPPYSPDINDERDKKSRFIVIRKGQSKFKKNLIKYYGHYCVITRCNIPEAIEASHVFPYRGEKDNNLRNGLLLRTDLHELFDADLIGIHPDSLTIHLHPEISGSYYGEWEGKQIILTRNDITPSKEALQYRWETFVKKVELFSQRN
jgi:putative restriction endonuclease